MRTCCMCTTTFSKVHFLLLYTYLLLVYYNISTLKGEGDDEDDIQPIEL